MPEYIEREAVRNALYDADAITMKGVAILNQFPAADVVAVVRCGKCKHWDKGELYCHHPAGMTFYGKKCANEGFCYFGERRDEDGTEN